MASNTRTLELHIDGMDCAECALHVQEQISGVDGVKQAKVLLAAEKGIVSFDPQRTNLDAIKDAVAAIGYKAQAADEVLQETPRSERLFSVIRLAFVAVVGLLALIEVVGEAMGWLDSANDLIPTPLAVAAVLFGGYPIFKTALLGLRARSINVDLLMSIGIVAAMAIGEFVSAALLVLFILIAHFLESFTTDKARAAIRELVALTPKRARVVREGQEIEVAADELVPGDVVVVRPGETIPADGLVAEGRSSVNQAPITGESMPVEKIPGDEVFAATLNELGSLRVTVTRVGANTTLGKIIRLVEEAEGNKAPVQRFADKFTAYFLPVVIAAAVLTFLISGDIVPTIAVLVVACPCAVALATPLAVVASVGSAARRGLLIKGGLHLEALAKVDTVLMDKTGTLTLGEPQVTDILAAEPPAGTLRGDRDRGAEILELAGALERYSEHPLAAAILAEAEARGLSHAHPEEFAVVPGQGVTAELAGRDVVLGNRKLLAARDITIPAALNEMAKALERQGKTAVFVASDGETLGAIAVADVIRREVPEAIAELKHMGLEHLILLTGDNERTASAVAARLGIEYRAELLPEDKIEIVRQLQEAGRKVAMIGDGINDAPALTQADVGIAMGVAGTDVALEASDVALMRDDWSQIPEAMRIGRRAFRTIKQNISFGVAFNVVGITLAAVGILTPVLAAAAESLPDVAVFLNSSRLIRR